MRAKHTPGPHRVLVVYDTERNHRRVTVCTPYTYTTAGDGVPEVHLADCGPVEPQNEANARLFARASQMVDLLRVAVTCAWVPVRGSDRDDAMRQREEARALLAQIDGEGN